jgi:hypothetical protein
MNYLFESQEPRLAWDSDGIVRTAPLKKSPFCGLKEIKLNSGESTTLNRQSSSHIHHDSDGLVQTPIRGTMGTPQSVPVGALPSVDEIFKCSETRTSFTAITEF